MISRFKRICIDVAPGDLDHAASLASRCDESRAHTIRRALKAGLAALERERFAPSFPESTP
jgi:hypothetical protein